MGEVVEGLGPEAARRIGELRAAGRFFWIDVSLADAQPEEVAEALGIPEDAHPALFGFGGESSPSRKFHADADHVVFEFYCFLESEPQPGEEPLLDAVAVHVLVSGDYVLTLHESPVALPSVIEHDPPHGRSEQYAVYTVLDGMVVTAFDALNQTELALESLQSRSSNMRGARVKMKTLQALSSRLSAMRRRLGPQRGFFERVSEEIGRVEGLEGDQERLFERIGGQLNRLVDSIDAAGDALAKLIDLRLNETTYWLTVVATVFLPLTFVTGFFGMNFGWMVREINTPLAFLLLGVGGCAAGVVATLYLVRRRGTPIEPDEPATRGPASRRRATRP
jgi:magnesium transporter